MQKIIILDHFITIYKSISLVSGNLGNAYPGDVFEFLGYVSGWAKIRCKNPDYPGEGETEIVDGYFTPTNSSDKTNILVSKDEVYSDIEKEAKKYFAENRPFVLFEGKVDPDGNFKLDVDFIIGDSVAVRNQMGKTANVFITEIMYSDDVSGGYNVVPIFEKTIET